METGSSCCNQEPGSFRNKRINDTADSEAEGLEDLWRVTDETLCSK